ncbi:hypothetical protein BDV34DRAFT_219087 [Aspergillus parasiticus]|uniref:Uncharacterized protein n=1 Tax=Aspergillus parasiticus TaxID=5067 RepID=A0A5N6E2X3_ASPPA|nr:hypothetical protein BDV34DRAFT_219087 [Aspergillus parasiticus]
MAIFTDGKSTAINSPRHLTLRHAIRAVKLDKLQKKELEEGEEGPSLPKLKPGQEQLFSFWAPSLTAGKIHQINVQQTINPNNGQSSLQLDAQQDFYVDAPRYSLPEGSVYSVYPPPGYTEEARILPHVVLSDPHLPWERQGTLKGIPDSKRNKVPWLALILFTQDELRLPIEDRDGADSIFPSLPKPVQQTSRHAIRMSLKDLYSTKHIVAPIKAEDGQAETADKTMADFIFIKPELFTSLFSPFSDANERENVMQPDTSPYRFLSHVRKINTAGMAVAGREDVGIFSVVIANRSGPLDYPTPTTVCAHLVSIEGVEEDITFPIPSDRKYAALCSLHSWSYTVTPPNSLNVPEAFKSLGQTLGPLRPPDKVIKNIRSTANRANAEMSNRLAKRLEDGYSLVKHRTATGEMTVALFRGPFTPTYVARRWKTTQDSDADLNRCSNSGLDLQILDKAVGIMDISYSVAWQVGRMLALADQPFTTALIRVRTTIHQRAMAESKRIALERICGKDHIGREALIQGLPEMCKNLGKITVAGEGEENGFGPRPASKRWNRRTLEKCEYPRLDYLSELIEKEYPQQAVEAAYDLAMGTDKKVYDETNHPVSVDWMILLAWVMNRMFLDGVPAHYLITDPSHIEHERLKFFHIDANWTDALIDGALSPGNHLGEDRDRVAIKRALNRYIYEKPERLVHPPQIPTYGFYLRSDLVTMFPDLKVTTLPVSQKDIPDKAPLLRHEIITDGLMLGLLDRVPCKDEFEGLVFTQPPHQQRFAAAATLTPDTIEVVIRKQYTVGETDRKTDKKDKDPLEVLELKKNDANNLFVWGSRPDQTDLHILRLPHFADLQLETLQEKMGTFGKGRQNVKYFDDDTPTSALLALQLSDPIYSLRISLDIAQGAECRVPDIRTFNLLAPSMVNRVISRVQTDTSVGAMPEPEPESNSLIASTSFERPKEPVSTSYNYDFSLAPHTHAIHTEDAERESRSEIQPFMLAASLSSQGHSSPASPPEYECRVSGVGVTGIHIDKDNLPQDLIFSIRVSNNTNNRYKLTAFHIWIRLGEANINRKRLMVNYTGPGATMLSNLRFNVLLKFIREKDKSRTLRISLLPRSTKQYVDITLVKEMSFLLALAQVNRFGRMAQMKLAWKADYSYDSIPSSEGEFPATIYE